MTFDDERVRRDASARKELMEAPVLRLRRHARLEPVETGDVPTSMGIGPNQQALVVWSTPAGRDALRAVTVNPAGASFPDARAAEPVAIRITTHDPEPSGLVRIAELPVAHSFVQPLPVGSVLLVGARCHWGPEGADENAIIYEADGTVRTTATVGDGIEHVQATDSGEVWIGYFDEGVYGNYGWGAGTGPEPIGSHGLLRWSHDLSLSWRYPYESEFGVIDDCYALNVVGNSAWACYYSGFPIVEIRDGEIAGWRNDVSGARALLVDGQHVALVGGYGPHRDRIVAGVLRNGVFEVEQTRRLVLEDGNELPPVPLLARGPRLHAIIGRDWFTTSLDDLGWR